MSSSSTTLRFLSSFGGKAFGDTTGRVCVLGTGSSQVAETDEEGGGRFGAWENVRLTFEQKAWEHFQDMTKSNFESNERIAGDR